MIEAFSACPELFDLYVKLWGHPAEDLRVQHADSVREFHVLTLLAPGTVARIATLGLGSCPCDDGTDLGVELLLVVGREELGDVGTARVARFLADIGTHLLRYSVRPVEGSVILKTSIAPWAPDALAFDLPRGEPEELEKFVADGHALRVIWTVPVYADEARLVQREGMEALDALVEQGDFSLADIRRPSLAGWIK